MQSNSALEAPSIAFVAIDIYVEDENFDQYDAQSAAEKIDQIKNRIIAICNELKEKESKQELQTNSMWIVAWREYGITEADSRVITPETKLLIKKVMQELTDHYPQLTIIAGTVATQKDIHKRVAKQKIDEIQDRYAQIMNIEQKEIMTGESKQVKEHLNAVLAVKNTAVKNGFRVIRNTCFIFPGNYKRSKIAPFRELGDQAQENSVFYPGRFGNCIFRLPRPGTHKVFTVGIEICRENFFNILQISGGKQPLLHLVLSDSISLMPQHCRSSYMIQIDSQNEIRFLNNEDPLAPKLAVYSLDLLNNFNLRAVNQLSEHPVSPKNNQSKLMTVVHSESLFESVVLAGDLTEEFIQNHLKDVNKLCGNDKLTALHYVVRENKPDLALFLLQRGANPNIQDAKGQTPASLVLNGDCDLEILEALINAHADLRIKDSRGRTAFDSLQALIASGHELSKDLIRLRDEYVASKAAKALAKNIKIKKRSNKVLAPVGLFKTPIEHVPVAETTRSRKKLRI